MRKIAIFCMIIILTLNLLSYTALAIDITNIYTCDSDMRIFINADIPPTSAQLGTSPCDIISVKNAGELPSETLIFVDTSGSIPTDIQSKTAELISMLIDGKQENEKFAIASFGTDTNYLCDYTTDRYELVKAAEKLVYDEKFTYVYSVLDEAVKGMSDDVFTKIIVISDGVENSKDGITYDEILRTVSESHIPIYAVGIENNNQEPLKKLYAFSRNSAADSVTISADSDISQICAMLEASRDMVCAEITIPDECADGSVKYLKITGDGYECGIDIRTPVAVVSETPTETTAAGSSETSTAAAAETVSEKNVQPFNIGYVVTAAAAAVVAASAAVITVKLKKDKPQPTPQPIPQPTPQSDPNYKTKETKYDPIPVSGEIVIQLTNINDPSRSYRHALGRGVTVGRDSSQCMIAIENDEYISKKHCRIYRSGERIMLENYSRNAVKINDNALVHAKGCEPPGTRLLLEDDDGNAKEIKSGDRLRIGHTELRFEMIGG